MNTFKAFLKIVWMNKVAIALYTVIFLILSIVSTNQGNNENPTTFKKVDYPVALFDEDNSTISKGLKDYVSEFATIVDLEDEKNTLKDGLYNKQIVAVIRVKEGMGEQAKICEDVDKIQIQSIPGTQYATYVETQITNYMNTLSMNLKTDMGEDDAVTKTAEILSIKANVVYITREEVDNKQGIFFSYIPYLMTSVIMVGLGPCIIAFNKKEVKSRMDASPYKTWKKNIGIISGMLITSAIFCILFMAMSVVMNGMEMFSTRGLLFLVNVVSYCLFALAMTFMAGIMMSTTNALNMVSNVLGMGMSFLGGVFVPVEILSDGMLKLAKCLPTYWYIKATETIVRTDFCPEDMQFVFNCYGIQILFAVAILAVVLALTKIRKFSK